MRMRSLVALDILALGLLVGVTSCGAVLTTKSSDVERWLTQPSIAEKRVRLRDHRTLGASEYSEVIPSRHSEAAVLLRSSGTGYVELTCSQAMSLTKNFFAERCAQQRPEAGQRLFLVPGVTDLPGGLRLIQSGTILWIQTEGIGEPDERVFTPLVVQLDDRPKVVHVLSTRYE